MIDAAKRQLRSQAIAARRAQTHKDELSQQVIERLFKLPCYQSAQVVMWYLDVRDEVRTRYALPRVLASDKKMVVPYCVDDHLELFVLRSISELVAGAFGILEPETALRDMPGRAASPDELQLVVVPGVAFDRSGNRLGHGKGFYDRLLGQIASRVTKVALAFDCQIIDSIPSQPHDIAMDIVLTPTEIIRRAKE